MPNRIIREDMLTSDRVDQLDAPAEVFYRRLLNKVDDHGLFDARLAILRTGLFPLRSDRIREADISRWMAACQKAGLIVLYVVDGKPYGQALRTKWEARSKPRFPLPASANNCAQLQTDSPVVVVVDVDVGESDATPPAPPTPGEKEARASRLPADWTLPDDWAAWAKAERPDLDAKLEGAKFADHWRSKGGKDGRRTDWLATWRNWIRNAFGPKPGTQVAAKPVAGNSPEVKETLQSRVAAERAFCRQQVELGLMEPEVAQQRIADLAAKLGVPV